MLGFMLVPRAMFRWLLGGAVGRVFWALRLELRESLEHCQWNIFFRDILERPAWTHVGGVHYALFFGYKSFTTSLAPESMSKVDVNSKSVRLVGHEFAVRTPEHFALV